MAEDIYTTGDRKTACLRGKVSERGSQMISRKRTNITPTVPEGGVRVDQSWSNELRSAHHDQELPGDESRKDWVQEVREVDNQAPDPRWEAGVYKNTADQEQSESQESRWCAIMRSILTWS